MTDRELLELAAKAAGVELQPMEVKNVRNVGDDRFIGYMVSADKWHRGWFNPITDDGDALRLVVALGIDVCFGANYVIARGSVQMPTVNNAGYPYAATRRAIVRAAAEIGKAMK